MSKRYNTPHRDRIIKTRVTEEEHADFMERLTAYGMSQSEFIRQAITGATVKPIACLHREADRGVREDRRQPQPDRPLSERVRDAVQCPRRRGSGGAVRPRCLEVSGASGGR